MSIIEFPRSAAMLGILRLWTYGATSEFERHIVDGVRPGVSQNSAQTVAESFVCSQLERVVFAQSISSEIGGIAQEGINRIKRPTCIERLRVPEQADWRYRIVEVTAEISDGGHFDHQRPGRDLLLDGEIELPA